MLDWLLGLKPAVAVALVAALAGLLGGVIGFVSREDYMEDADR